MAPGEVFGEEIREQPGALAGLLDDTREVAGAARALAARRPGLIRLVAHGSSDNAAAYGTYAFGLLAEMTALRDSVSLTVYFEAEVDLRGSAVVALSQSGRTPDVVAYVERARAAGALCIALTNEPDSDLARAAGVVVSLRAGPERAVAATKTYTNELAALALLAGHAAGRGREIEGALSRTVDLIAATVEEAEDPVREAADLLASQECGRMFVVGRGPELATARETALKVTEVARVAAEPLSATGLAHGPVAALDPTFPVWIIVTNDAALPAVLAAAGRARDAGAMVLACGDAAHLVQGASIRFAVPGAPMPLLAPLLSVVPGQLFAGSLAIARGLDPDHPPNLQKVTLAP